MMLAAKIVLVALCALLVLVILLQSGRSAGLSGVITADRIKPQTVGPRDSIRFLAR
ncbi:hypothetical protein GCM10025858_26740 [Alicyclobacillus sacchari]|uniref:preprotein translocase subunit SecG n=1 Tax=Alicyclobacillus sacchari TaxID=392010 RepID=UPI0023E903B2|nr:hypothetical protein GCM10025858_26740 [Alicyclobacillus sacchari]